MTLAPDRMFNRIVDEKTDRDLPEICRTAPDPIAVASAEAVRSVRVRPAVIAAHVHEEKQNDACAARAAGE
ncbi:hypothetical protein [Sphingomonas gei]|uniref:hypothetical protein n=1 Tax=Sphingomonas gei TaxID=1395960 RepID=UPI001441A2DC|nr:hypothetical protein [Sphingomonas gei]